MDQFDKLCEYLAGLDAPPAVAFSGGVDSSLLLAAALRVYGKRAVAVHARSPLQAPGEHENALAVAGSLGCHPRIVEIDPYGWPEVAANDERRCYHCKLRLYRLFGMLAAQWGCAALLDGTNSDDLQSHRPGLQAIRELAVATPLAAVGLEKGRIRELARQLDLPNWNKPAASCLATRIKAGRPLTREAIALVARGETYLKRQNFLGCRFRHMGQSCLVEVEAADYRRLLSSAIWPELNDFCRAMGFVQVEAACRPNA